MISCPYRVLVQVGHVERVHHQNHVAHDGVDAHVDQQSHQLIVTALLQHTAVFKQRVGAIESILDVRHYGWSGAFDSTMHLMLECTTIGNVAKTRDFVERIHWKERVVLFDFFFTLRLEVQILFPSSQR